MKGQREAGREQGGTAKVHKCVSVWSESWKSEVCVTADVEQHVCAGARPSLHMSTQFI